ncbi:hypothetical protein [Antrihabitans stalactiti]|uniref:DUF3108 domain-containing protein n=1 Tax=Antrihabitans stalactiti TaxID=2584121 RepID=A0A848KCS3_9NOCA|nr:hypothetical protein [Antrihabitans stalactiti]NMN95506.1 DUF3108 domain-containing protein [Antrihabitans stalactiti]
MITPFRDPGIADGEKSVYSIKVGDAPATGQLTSIVEHDGDEAYVASINTGSDDQYSMKVEQRIQRSKGSLVMESYKAASLFAGKVVSREEGYFVDTQHLQFGGEVGPFPSGTMPLLSAATLLRGLDFQRGSKAKYDLWLAFSVVWPLEVKVEKRTTMKIGAGSFDAWQVRIRPSFNHINGLLDKVVAGFLPPFILHMDAHGSHRMLRFSFPSGPLPWNPRCVLELEA